MQNVSVISVGRLSKAYWKTAALEYEKRLSTYCKLRSVELKERGEDEKALRREAEDFKAAVPKKAVTVALCIEGEQIDSDGLAKLLKESAMQGNEVCFFIGSSQGMDDGLKQWCDKRISMSKMTFPHQLARVMFEEQLYRAFTIISGGKYHK